MPGRNAGSPLFPRHRPRRLVPIPARKAFTFSGEACRLPASDRSRDGQDMEKAMSGSQNAATNVVRFPIEHRMHPTLDLLRELAPDVRQVLQRAETFGLPVPDAMLRHAVDRETAGHILNHVRAEPGPERRLALKALLASAVAPAVAACRVADEAGEAAQAARQRFVAMTAAGHHDAPAQEVDADRLALDAATRLLEAHLRCEEAEGVARAVGFALRNESWVPFDLATETERLCRDGMMHAD